MRPIFIRFFDSLSALHAAEVTVISFLIMSLLGGVLLFVTEHDRDVHAKVAVFAEAQVRASVSGKPEIVIPERTEQQTYLQDVQYRGENFIDTLFMAVSALCVTGLTSTDFSQFTPLGKIIVLILVQMGGLGIVLFTSIFAIAVVRGLSERNSFGSILSGILDTTPGATYSLIKHIIYYTILFEGVGFVIMGSYLQWFADPNLIGHLNPWWWSLFHSVSAFNNAGFSLLNNNLLNFVKDPVISLTISALIIFGGIGYPVLIAMHARIRSWFVRSDAEQKKLEDEVRDVVSSPVQTKIAVQGTIFLLVLGTIFIGLLEADNPAMSGFTLGQKILASFFQSVTARTAGFNTLDYGTFASATIFVTMLLMFIGANPAGTGGGIKIPTAAVLYSYIKDWFAAPGQAAVLHGEKISRFAVSHAIRLIFASFVFLGFVTALILIGERQFLITPDPTINFEKVLFEIISAFGTVGLSMGFVGGVTSFSAILSGFSKFMLIVTMMFGRLGALTILAALPWKRRYANATPSQDFPGAQKIQIG